MLAGARLGKGQELYQAALILTTVRMTLRPLLLSDADELFVVRGDPIAMTFWDWPADVTTDATREMTRKFLTEADAGEALYMSARLTNGDYVGLFDLSELDRNFADLGFMLAPRFWKQGLALEGAQAMINEARRRGLSALKARTHAANAASLELLLRLGFEAVGGRAPAEVAPNRLVQCEHFRLNLAPA